MALVWIFKKLILGNLFATKRGQIKLFSRMYRTLFPSKALTLSLQTIGEKLGEAFVYKLATRPVLLKNRDRPPTGLAQCPDEGMVIRDLFRYFKQ